MAGKAKVDYKELAELGIKAEAGELAEEEGYEYRFQEDREYESGRRLREYAIKGVVEQIEAHDPEFVYEEYLRLQHKGRKRNEAKAIIASSLIKEIYHIAKDGREFSEEAYRKDVEKTIRNLRSTDRMEFQTLDIENEIADICFSFSRNETEDNCRSIEDLWPRIHEYVIDNWYREKSDGTLEKPSISEIRDLSDWEIDFNAFLDETFEILYNAKHHEQIIHILKDAADLFKWEEDDYLDSYLNDLGMALYGAGRVKEADKMYRERLAEDPGNMTILKSYLWELVYTTKEYERALEVTEEQLPLKKGFDPNLEMVYLRVIDACDAMGNTEEANKYRKMLKEYEREEKEKKQRVKERFDGTLFQEPVVKAPKIGRNDPCPCGSGKKYKKCCGKN